MGSLRFLSMLSLLVTSIASNAQSLDCTNKYTSGAIPFIINSSTNTEQNFPDINTQDIVPFITKNTSNPLQVFIPIDQITAFLGKVRKAMCETTGNADVRVWLSVDASGKVFGVGSSGQSGVEITFHCK